MIKQTFVEMLESKFTMGWIIFIPAIISLINNRPGAAYAYSVVETFIIIFIINIIINKFFKKRQH